MAYDGLYIIVNQDSGSSILNHPKDGAQLLTSKNDAAPHVWSITNISGNNYTIVPFETSTGKAVPNVWVSASFEYVGFQPPKGDPQGFLKFASTYAEVSLEQKGNAGNLYRIKRPSTELYATATQAPVSPVTLQAARGTPDQYWYLAPYGHHPVHETNGYH
ncbi:hypothetical protein SISSUDRAFT_1067027 [Sistotremastrum suecicum HHB10207 ss-3]|uniref:Ricin B lectin domain-containing protein n=1 Tax=Sistotremastrum suecicum HHB10207 ss-3 TaxID=1314776 RepID=A0A165XLM6_9AGAM|nr:hypothetical protein SISSUDRAFT_1067027 [Sistotremastrum suecicum HHB10207 ss-3]